MPWMVKSRYNVVDQTTHPPKCHSFVGLDRQIGSSPPAKSPQNKKSVWYVFSDVPHTHTHTPTFTHIFATHLLSHTSLSHTFFHTPLCHTPSFTHRFVTRNFVTHRLSHTIFHTPLCHTKLCHTPSFTHNFVTHTHHLRHTSLSHTHTNFSHTIHHLSHTQLCHTHFAVSHPTLSYTTLSHTHTQLFTYNFSIDPPPPPLSTLPSPSRLNLLFLLIGRSWLVGLSGPLIFQGASGFAFPAPEEINLFQPIHELVSFKWSRWRPRGAKDKNQQDPNATEKFQSLQEAYEARSSVETSEKRMETRVRGITWYEGVWRSMAIFSILTLSKGKNLLGLSGFRGDLLVINVSTLPKR